VTHALLTQIAVAVAVAAILGLGTAVVHLLRKVGRMTYTLRRVVSAVEGELADPVTGDPGRAPLAQQLAGHTAQIATLDARVGEILAEFRPNHGSSARDRWDAMQRALDVVLTEVRVLQVQRLGPVP
jgi:hypothetical protein